MTIAKNYQKLTSSEMMGAAVIIPMIIVGAWLSTSRESSSHSTTLYLHDEFSFVQLDIEPSDIKGTNQHLTRTKKY